MALIPDGLGLRANKLADSFNGSEARNIFYEDGPGPFACSAGNFSRKVSWDSASLSNLLYVGCLDEQDVNTPGKVVSFRKPMAAADLPLTVFYCRLLI